MKVRFSFFSYIFFIMGLMMQSCIHEYPYIVNNGSHEKGENPTQVTAYIEVTYDLSWQSILHVVDFSTSTRARTDRPHHFVIEILEGQNVICHDEEYLSDNDFANGILHHKLSVALEASDYKISAWYDHQDEEGNYYFDSRELKSVEMTNFSTIDAELMTCAYATDYLDLSDISTEETWEVTGQLEMTHPGARFEIVATDVQQFITNNKEALNQGDSFTVHISINSGANKTCNIYNSQEFVETESLELSGRMRLPFAEYDRLKIAEAFFFCNSEDQISARLWVTNSSLVTVAQTEEFYFPVKRGYITVVTGDFLTNGIQGLFSINSVWDGEIIFEI